MRFFLRCSPLVFLLAGRPAAAQTVEGTVANALTGDGIPGVRVTLLLATAPPYTAATDAQGHFRIENVKDGVYSATYFSRDYPPFLPDMDPSSRFQVTAGNKVNLKVRLMPFPRVTGRVLDARGEPVDGAQVNLSAPGNNSQANTDAEGSFEFHFGLSSGSYILSALAPAGAKPPDPDPASGQPRAWTRTFPRCHRSRSCVQGLCPSWWRGGESGFQAAGRRCPHGSRRAAQPRRHTRLESPDRGGRRPVHGHPGRQIPARWSLRIIYPRWRVAPVRPSGPPR